MALVRDRGLVRMLERRYTPVKPLVDEMRRGYELPAIFYSTRHKMKAGVCYSIGGRTIRLTINPHLKPEHIEPVIIHELAHSIVQYLHGNVQSHGREWRHWMYKLGQNPKARHDFFYLYELRKGDWYACERCGHRVKTRRPLEERGAWHRGCRGLFRLVEAGKDLPPRKAALDVMPASDKSAKIKELLGQLKQAQGMKAESRNIRRQLRMLGHTGGLRHSL